MILRSVLRAKDRDLSFYAAGLRILRGIGTFTQRFDVDMSWILAGKSNTVGDHQRLAVLHRCVELCVVVTNLHKEENAGAYHGVECRIVELFERGLQIGMTRRCRGAQNGTHCFKAPRPPPCGKVGPDVKVTGIDDTAKDVADSSRDPIGLLFCLSKDAVLVACQ